MHRSNWLRGLVLPAMLAACSEPITDTAVSNSLSAAAMRDVVLVGNSVAGTVSILDGNTFQNLGSVNVIPDFDARIAAINADLIHLIAYSLITDRQKLKHFEPADGKRFVDDVFASPDGTRLYVSRSNLGDVAAFDLTAPSHPLVWRTDVSGFKADHATLSPDGKRIIVSATLSDIAQVIDAATGSVVGSFGTGHYPHQNDYSADGRHIYNSSIGDVSLPFWLSFLKGARRLTIVDAQTLAQVKTFSFDSGIRPAVISADEKTFYTQLSYLNGFVKFDLTSGTTTATYEQPPSAFATANYATRDDYPHDSAHHGLALSGDGTRLCDAGTIDNTVTIVRASDLTAVRTVDVGLIPYWSTTSADGAFCVVSLSGANAVSIIRYATAQQVAVVPVGTFPQRSRLGRLPETVIDTLSP